MKIAIFDVIGNYAGMHYYDQAYAELFKQNGCKVVVYSNFRNSDFARKFFPSFFTKNKLVGVLCFLWAYIKYACFLVHNDYEKVIYMTYGEIYELPFLWLSSFSSKTFIDVHEVHALRYKDNSCISQKFENLYAKRIDRVIFHSDRTLSIIGGKVKTMLYVPHLKYVTGMSYNTDKLGDDVKRCFKSSYRKYLFFGSLSKAKGIDIVIDVFKKMSDDGMPFELVIAGKNVDDTDFSSVRNLPGFHIVDRHINDDEMTYLYRNTNFVLLPYRETSQSGIFEMAAHFHKPMLMSNVTYFKEMQSKFPSFGNVAPLDTFDRLIDRSLSIDISRYYNTLDCDRFTMKRDIQGFFKQFIMDGQLETYHDFDEKSGHYCSFKNIDTEQDLDDFIKSIPSNSFIFRGMNEATYKMYTSSQRYWIWNDPIIRKLGAKGYNDFIHKIIDRIRNDKEIADYLNKNGIPINDMELLAMLQHYAVLSPLLDFTLDINSALFFATDNSSKPTGDKIDDYVSVYYIDKSIDWIQASVQRINTVGAARASEMLDDFKQSHKDTPVDTSQVEEEMRDLPFDKLADSDISFIPLEGPAAGTMTAAMPTTNFTTSYRITNPRLLAQSGLFLLNLTPTEPLVELMNRVTNSMFVNCVNIHKKLVPYIQSKYLEPKNITKDTMYFSTDDDKWLEEKIKSVIGLDK